MFNPKENCSSIDRMGFNEDGDLIIKMYPYPNADGDMEQDTFIVPNEEDAHAGEILVSIVINGEHEATKIAPDIITGVGDIVAMIYRTTNFLNGNGWKLPQSKEDDEEEVAN